MITTPSLPLEDELGDVLEKAMRRAGLTAEALAARAEVAESKIRDAMDYRPELSCAELRRLAGALKLNEVGFCAVGSGRYPKPEIGDLPFSVWSLRMPHGIGVANAYLVGGPDTDRAVLFDTGAGIGALEMTWPGTVHHLDAVFLTHVEAEHAGGLCEVVARFHVSAAFFPRGASAPCGHPMGEGEVRRVGALEIAAFTTPGHAAAHNCYLVRSSQREARALLISGDLVFAGSAGGAYFSSEQLQANLSRMLRDVPPETVIAPGHGPLTTVAHELRYNPFVL